MKNALIYTLAALALVLLSRSIIPGSRRIHRAQANERTHSPMKRSPTDRHPTTNLVQSFPAHLGDPRNNPDQLVAELRQLDAWTLSEGDADLYAYLTDRPGVARTEEWWHTLNEIMEQPLQAIAPERIVPTFSPSCSIPTRQKSSRLRSPAPRSMDHPQPRRTRPSARTKPRAHPESHLRDHPHNPREPALGRAPPYPEPARPCSISCRMPRRSVFRPRSGTLSHGSSASFLGKNSDASGNPSWRSHSDRG